MPPTYPDVSTWIPDRTKWSDVAEGLLEITLGALALFPAPTTTDPTATRRARYTTTFVQHGPMPDIDAQQKNRQLVVAFAYGFLGQAGEENYQNFKGHVGIGGLQTARFNIVMACPYVMPTGGLSPLAARTDRQQTIEGDMLTDAYIVWSSLVATMMGGITPRPWPTPGGERGDEMMVGPLEAINPAGNLIGYKMMVQVQT